MFSPKFGKPIHVLASQTPHPNLHQTPNSKPEIRINLKFEKLEHGVAMPLLERYVHPYLRSCSMCKKYEHRPDQFHIWMSQGAIR
jgi:hypothetical protein